MKTRPTSRGWQFTPEGTTALALAVAWGLEQGLLPLDELVGDTLVAVEAGDVTAVMDWARRLRGPLITLARQAWRDATTRIETPSYWTCAQMVERAEGWEAAVGWGSTIHQAGVWPSRELAIAALKALRPDAMAGNARNEGKMVRWVARPQPD